MKIIKYLIGIVFYSLLITGCNNNNSTNPSFITYDTVKICLQVWMQKNLDVQRYRNGDMIRYCPNGDDWKDAGNKKEGAWCYYNNDSTLGKIYGKLYNWYAVNDPRGLAPAGWHIPTDEEWKTMEKCLGMLEDTVEIFGFRGTDQGCKLSGNFDLWRDGTLRNDTNFGKSGFNALPAGMIHQNETFGNRTLNGIWWNSTEFDSSEAIIRNIFFDSPKISRGEIGRASCRERV